MALSINLSGIIIILIFALDIFLHRSKNIDHKKFYEIYTAILSFMGVLGVFVLRFVLVAHLDTELNDINKIEYFDMDFYLWLLNKYEIFLLISVVLLVVVISILLAMLKRKNVWLCSNLGTAIVLASVVFMCFSIWYTIGTINKFFDLGSYIGALSIFVIFALHIPIVADRIASRE